MLHGAPAASPRSSCWRRSRTRTTPA